MAVFSSCSDFLKEEDKDKVIPKTTEEIEAMLHQEAFLNVTWMYASDIMTDDVEENTASHVGTAAKNDMKSLYTWQQNIEYDGNGERTTATNKWWELLYNNVLVANYVIEHFPDIEGTEAERQNILGEAYFLRARAYLELVCIYAPAYDPATAASTLGVPLRLGTGVTNNYKRNTMAEVYAQIESDLKSAIGAFDKSSIETSLWHPNAETSKLLLSRTYLYEQKWDDVISIVSELIAGHKGGLYNLKNNMNVPFVSAANPEILHSYGNTSALITESNESQGATKNFDMPMVYSGKNTNDGATRLAYGVSNDLINSFLPGDCRLQVFFTDPEGEGKSIFAKWYGKFTSFGAYSYRMSEAYLNRAEAYAAKGDDANALADVKELIRHRVTDINKVTFPTAGSGEVRRFVLDERRRELCGENHRWYDLKRNSSWYAKQITHRFTLRSGNGGGLQGSESYILAPNDPNYTFELPEAETNVNTTIEKYGKRIAKPAIKN